MSNTKYVFRNFFLKKRIVLMSNMKYVFRNFFLKKRIGDMVVTNTWFHLMITAIMTRKPKDLSLQILQSNCKGRKKLKSFEFSTMKFMFLREISCEYWMNCIFFKVLQLFITSLFLSHHVVGRKQILLLSSIRQKFWRPENWTT